VVDTSHTPLPPGNRCVIEIGLVVDGANQQAGLVSPEALADETIRLHEKTGNATLTPARVVHVVMNYAPLGFADTSAALLAAPGHDGHDNGVTHVAIRFYPGEVMRGEQISNYTKMTETHRTLPVGKDAGPHARSQSELAPKATELAVVDETMEQIGRRRGIRRPSNSGATG